jgi:hypothetical protein
MFDSPTSPGASLGQCPLSAASYPSSLSTRCSFFYFLFFLRDSNPGPPSPLGKSQPLSLILARIGGALEPNDSLKESRDALVTHSSTSPHAMRIVFRAFNRSPSELGDSLVVNALLLLCSLLSRLSGSAQRGQLSLDRRSTPRTVPTFAYGRRLPAPL